MLRDISFTQGSGEKSSSVKKGATVETPSGLMTYFVWRREVVAAALAIMSQFSKKKSLMSFLSDIDDSALAKVLHMLEEVSHLEMPDAEGLISDSELSINERLRKARGIDQQAAKNIIEDQIGEVAADSQDESRGRDRTEKSRVRTPLDAF